MEVVAKLPVNPRTFGPADEQRSTRHRRALESMHVLEAGVPAGSYVGEVRNVKKNALRIAITLVVVFVLLWLVVGPWMSTPSPQVPEVPERVAPVSS